MYDSFFRPYVSKHETDIDRNLLELRTRAGDIAILYWQRAASYGQTRIYDILQYVAAQSTPQPRPSQVVYTKFSFLFFTVGSYFEFGLRGCDDLLTIFNRSLLLPLLFFFFLNAFGL